MKIASWNVNGIRACLKKGFMDFIEKENPDIICIQETKAQPEQVDLVMDGYTLYWNAAERKGYSGTANFTKVKPLNINKGIGVEEHDHEGRVLTLEMKKFFLVNVYTPNAKRELTRLSYREKWEDDFRSYLKDLEKKKPVVVCGDLNVAHREIDLARPKPNRGNAGFTDEEREKFSALLDSGFIDTYRHFYPDKEGAYTWWSYMGKSREKNVGWRIDYFCVSKKLKKQLNDAKIHPEYPGSDHCPISLEING